MARYKTSQRVYSRIPFELYLKMQQENSNISAFIRTLIQKNFDNSEETKIETNLESIIPKDLLIDYLKIPEKIRESSLRAYIKNALKIFKDE